ncbi:unnamed protein product [Camellia sinensis]
MRKKFLRKRTTITIPMSHNTTTHRTSNNREYSSFFTSITHFFLASNSIGAMCRAYSRSDYALLFFIVFAYSASLLLAHCTLAYLKLPPHEKSIKKKLLKFAIWFLYSSIMFGVAFQFGPYFPHPGYGLSLFFVATICSALLFYVCMIVVGRSGCDECEREEKRKFSDCVEKVNESKIERCDSVLEKTSLVPHPAKSFDFCEEYVENSLKNQIDHGVEVEYRRRESQCENLKRESGGEERYGGVRRRSATAVRLAVIKRWLMFSKRSPFLELMSYYMMISSRGVVVGESDSGGRLCRRGPICNRLSNWSFICRCTASLDKGFGSGTWLKPLVIFHLKNTFLVKTVRDRERAMNPGSVDFPETLPSLQLYFLLGIVYAVRNSEVQRNLVDKSANINISYREIQNFSGDKFGSQRNLVKTHYENTFDNGGELLLISVLYLEPQWVKQRK